MDFFVDICLATYNGESYIEEFYSSLVQQSHKKWSLLIRDDMSIDSTLSIIKKISAHDSRVHLANGDYGNLGIIGNFSKVISSSTSEYVMLADQDDVWYPDKVETALKAIRSLEQANYGHITPTLVFSDLNVVDANLNLIHPSFIRMVGFENLTKPSFSQLLTQNIAPGCAMIVNRSLLDLALPIPKEAVMHDWWLILIASLFGHIGYIDKPTMAYRQHGKNNIGVPSYNVFDLFNGKYKKRLHKSQIQAAAIVSRYSNEMNTQDLVKSNVFANLSLNPRLFRQVLAYKNGLKKSGFIRNVVFYLLM